MRSWIADADTPSPDPRAGPAVLVTGVTGFLGGHFALAWRRARGPVVALARADDDAAARVRVLARQAASGMGQAPAADVTALAGDVARPLCGVAPGRITALRSRGIEAVWHFAASLRFEPGRRDEILAQNVGGTENALALAAAIGARRFVYVSTAYSCGIRDGLVAETLHPTEGPFNNAYEESKCLAEHLVLARGPALGLAPTILRPSIVVGPSTTWRPNGSDSGLYGLMDQVARLRGRGLDRDRPIWVHGNAQARLHLVPVDHLVRDCLALAASDFAGGPIVHLTSSGGPRVGDGAALISEAFGLPDFRIGELPPRPSRVELWLRRRLGFHEPYMHFSGSFARARPGAVSLGLEDFRRLVAGYLAARLAPSRAEPHTARPEPRLVAQES